MEILTMDINAFLEYHKLSPHSIDGPGCLEALLGQMEAGLAGRGKIPMIPSYLSPDTRPTPGVPCCVMDAGGTNLRVAAAVFDDAGNCTLSGLRKTAMPGTREELSFQDFYGTLAQLARDTGYPEKIGLCFSYNVLLERNLDGILHSWCKEVKVPEAPGKPVGASLARATGPVCKSVRVLNDSTAALLGACCQDRDISLGLILGTGINICYPEPCRNIPKVPGDLKAETMIISTEIGEFDGFPKSTFDHLVIAASGEPDMAHAEKQCAGGYLGDLIGLAWQAAARDGLLPPPFLAEVTLPVISDYLAGIPTSLPENEGARAIAATMIHRAAKIAAVLTAGPILRACAPGQSCKIVIEGSQFEKLTGFGNHFRRELEDLLSPYDIRISIAKVENSCLVGAAVAAFAEPM